MVRPFWGLYAGRRKFEFARMPRAGDKAPVVAWKQPLGTAMWWILEVVAWGGARGYGGRYWVVRVNLHAYLKVCDPDLMVCMCFAQAKFAIPRVFVANIFLLNVFCLF